MRRLVVFLPLALLLGIVLSGCDQPQPVAKTPTVGAPPPPPPPPPAASELAATQTEAEPAASAPNQPPLPVETKVGVFAGGLEDLAAPANAPAPTPAPAEAAPNPNTEVVKAGKGVGLKGRSLDEHEGIIVTPVKAYFAARERIFFEAEFPKNYQLYNASTGDVPKDFEDLKAKVLDPYGLTRKLPVLPQGHKYVWNPETQELCVERPKR